MNPTTPSAPMTTSPNLTTPHSRPVAQDGSSSKKRARQDLDARPITGPFRTPAPPRRITKLKNVLPNRTQERPASPQLPPTTPGGLDRAPLTSFGRPTPSTAPRHSFLYFNDGKLDRKPEEPLQLFGGSYSRSYITGKGPDVSASFPTSGPLSSTATSTKATSQSFGGSTTPTRVEKQSSPPRTSGFAARIRQKIQNRPPVSALAARIQARVAKREIDGRAKSFESTSNFEPATPSRNGRSQASEVSNHPSFEGEDPAFGSLPVAQSTPTASSKGKAVFRPNSPFSSGSVQSLPSKSWDGRLQQTSSFMADKVQGMRELLQANRESKRVDAKELEKEKLKKIAEEQERVRRDAIMKHAAEDLERESRFIEESTEIDTELDSDVETARQAARPQVSAQAPNPTPPAQEPVQVITL
jgi:hypothetical protein